MAYLRTLLIAVFLTPLRRLSKMLFQPASRYPADPRAVFVLGFSVFTGITALALDAGPATLESLLPRWGVTIWGASLVAGSVITLTGMARQTAGGIITEQIGSAMVAAATIYYSILAFYLLGPLALQTVGIIAAWGFACALRYIQLQVLITQATRTVDDRDIIRAYTDHGELPR